jgi:hypothetical protein
MKEGHFHQDLRFGDCITLADTEAGKIFDRFVVAGMLFSLHLLMTVPVWLHFPSHDLREEMHRCTMLASMFF